MNRRIPPSTRSGVALIEFTVGLVAVMVTIGALVQIGLLGKYRTDTMITATREASISGLDGEGEFQTMPRYILTWTDGEDDSRHSEDDARVMGSADAFQTTLTQTALPRDLSQYLPDAPLADVDTPERLILQFRMVQGASTRTGIDLLPVVRNWIYRRDSMNIRSEAWSVRLGDL